MGLLCENDLLYVQSIFFCPIDKKFGVSMVPLATFFVISVFGNPHFLSKSGFQEKVTKLSILNRKATTFSLIGKNRVFSKNINIDSQKSSYKFLEKKTKLFFYLLSEFTQETKSFLQYVVYPVGLPLQMEHNHFNSEHHNVPLGTQKEVLMTLPKPFCSKTKAFSFSLPKSSKQLHFIQQKNFSKRYLNA